MAAFVDSLWTSVFTPGTTPTLLVATNATFAALQALLFALLIATYSIHFLILSVLCGGLWYSITWFASELQAAQQKEQEAKRLRKQKPGAKSPAKDKDWKTQSEVVDSADDGGEETETETEGRKGNAARISDIDAERRVRVRVEQAVEEKTKEPDSKVRAVTSNHTSAGGSTVRQRTAVEVDRSGDLSSGTDSEWEKVEDGR